MKLAIMQPYFFPYIGYFQAISAVDKYILYSNLNFIKEAWMNRNRILQRNGEIQQICVPLHHKSSFSSINDIHIDNTKPWKKKMLLSISSCYKKAPFYEEIMPMIEGIISADVNLLKDLNACSIKQIASFLEINTEIDCDCNRFIEMENKLENIENDYSIIPYLEKTRPVKKVARVIEMCRMEDSCTFYNAIGGTALYSKEEFASYGIELKFVQTNSIEYKQCSKSQEFCPNLSIIDVLMNNGKEGTKQLLKEYVLV